MCECTVRVCVYVCVWTVYTLVFVNRNEKKYSCTDFV